MRRYKYLIFLVLLAVVFTGCSVSVGTTGDVRGFVYVPEDSQMRAASLESEDFVISAQSYAPSGYEPVVGAEVRIGSLKTWTDNDGLFRFSSVSTGSHLLTVTHASLRDPIKMTIKVYGGLNWVEDPGREGLRGGIGYYVVIGVEHFTGESRTSPIEDAKAVYKYLFDENQLAGLGRLLISEEGSEMGSNVWGSPTKDEIKDAIDEAIELARTSNRLDYLVIYFSGDSRRNILWDSDGESITDGELRDWVEPFPGPVTLILDGDESVTFVDGSSPQAFLKGDYTVLGGSLVDEESGTTESGLSWFTFNLLEGIRTRAADGGYGNGEITAQELYDYTFKIMEKENQDKPSDERQTPFLKEGKYADAVVFRYEK